MGDSRMTETHVCTYVRQKFSSELLCLKKKKKKKERERAKKKDYNVNQCSQSHISNKISSLLCSCSMISLNQIYSHDIIVHLKRNTISCTTSQTAYMSAALTLNTQNDRYKFSNNKTNDDELKIKLQ